MFDSSTVKELIESSFPHPSFTTCSHPPTFKEIYDLYKKCCINTAAVPSDRGSGTHGHLRIMLTEDEYEEVDEEEWEIPDNPGAIPDIPDNATPADIAKITSQHKTSLREYKLYNNVQAALRLILVEAIRENYLDAYKEPYIGLNNRTPKEIILYAWRTFAKISNHQKMENDKLFRQKWDPSEPFEAVIKRIDQAIEIAEFANMPYNENQILSNAYKIVSSTGLYTQDCKEWLRNDQNNTWEEFKEHFLKAQFDAKELADTTAQYGHANIMIQKIQDENNAALAAFTTAAKHDFDSLSKTCTQLTTQLELMQKQIKEKDDRIFQLLGNNNQNQNNNNQNPNNNRNNRKKKDNGSYCWTHGYLIATGHNSQTCKSKKEGHKDEATREKPMGGNLTGKPTNLKIQ